MLTCSFDGTVESLIASPTYVGNIKIGDFGLATTGIEGSAAAGVVGASADNVVDGVKTATPLALHRKPFGDSLGLGTGLDSAGSLATLDTADPDGMSLEGGGAGEGQAATHAALVSQSPFLATHDGSSLNHSDSLTGGIGTALYRAPEQEYSASTRSHRPHLSYRSSHQGDKDDGADASSSLIQGGNAKRNPEDVGRSGGMGRAYDEKADMFSLGVILFEMCHKPFSTGMERLLTLRRLREGVELPDAFEASCTGGNSVGAVGGGEVGVANSPEHQNLREIIQWLVRHDPRQRPSAVQLLASPLLPSRVDTDTRYLQEITEALWKPNSTAAAGIISVLFNSPLLLQQQSMQQQLYDSSANANYTPDAAAGTATNDSAASNSSRLPLTADARGATNSSLVGMVPYELAALQQSQSLLHAHLLPKLSLLDRGGHPDSSAGVVAGRVAAPVQHLEAIRRAVVQVFHSHGAVCFAPALLQLRSAPSPEVLLRGAALGGGGGGREGRAAGAARSPETPLNPVTLSSSAATPGSVQTPTGTQSTSVIVHIVRNNILARRYCCVFSTC